jgi:quercetin dioxygenase-like cupin family protein
MKLFNWSQVVEEQVNPLASRKIIHSDTMTVVRRRLLKGAILRLHRHVEEQLTMVEDGEVRIVAADEEQCLKTGDALAIPSNEPHSVEALQDSIVMDLFSRPVRGQEKIVAEGRHNVSESDSSLLPDGDSDQISAGPKCQIGDSFLVPPHLATPPLINNCRDG